jgi:uncharacterized membrane protein YesL
MKTFWAAYKKAFKSWAMHIIRILTYKEKAFYDDFFVAGAKEFKDNLYPTFCLFIGIFRIVMGFVAIFVFLVHFLMTPAVALISAYFDCKEK